MTLRIEFIYEVFNLLIIHLLVTYIPKIVILRGMLFSYKVIDKRRGKKQEGDRFHTSLRRTFGNGGS